MIYQRTAEWVMDKSPHTNEPKTETRRLYRNTDLFTTALATVVIGKDYGRVIQTVPNNAASVSRHPPHNAVHKVLHGSCMPRWEVGKVYAVQPARTAKGIGFIRVLGIRREDVRNITVQQAWADGFASKYDFLQVWTDMYDPKVDKLHGRMIGKTSAPWSLEVESDPFLPNHCPLFLWDRPYALYQCWAIQFEKVIDA